MTTSSLRPPDAPRMCRPRPLGLRSRLLAIALIPILGLSYWAIRETSLRSNQLGTARKTSTKIDTFVEVVRLQGALDAERVPTQAMVTGASFNVSPEVIKSLMGFDIQSRLAETRPVTDKSISGDRFATVRKSLIELRAHADSSRPNNINEKWNSLAEELRQLRSKDLQILQATIGDDLALSGSLDRLLAAERLVSATARTNLKMFELQGGSGERRDIRQDLTRDVYASELALQFLSDSSGPLTTQAIGKLATDPQSVRAQSTVATTLANPTKPLLANLQNTADDFAGLVRRSQLANDVLAAAAQDLRDQSLTSEAQARKSLFMTIAVVALIAVGSLLGALFSARSLIRPLQVLARRADLIARGELEHDPIPETGPSEVRVVASAFNDLVVNLGTLDEQVVALAAGQLDASVLQRGVPGDLGASVRRTVDRLSSSIRSRDELQQRLTHEASHDPLTQLPNRQAIIESLDAAIARATRYDEIAACLFVDLDGFKRANDFFGHRFGDEVLIQVAERLRALVRAVDSVGRLGGDEFIVVADRLARAEDSVLLARRIVATLSVPFMVDSKVCHIGASVGIAVTGSSTTGSTTASLLSDADMAVYRAKARGRGTVEVFDAALRRDMDRRTDVESAFPAAIAERQLYVAYQPIVERSADQSSKIVGVEALVRWNRPGIGLVPPNEFVPVIEGGPQIIVLGQFVLGESIRQLAAWKQGGRNESLTLSVNLSERHLATESVVDDVLVELERHGVEASSLIIELTETSLLSDVTGMSRNLAALRSAGVRIALDDFGTGFTSISQLALLPIDIVKIDRSFTDLTKEHTRRPIVEMMIGVGRTLGLTVVAEGVETVEQAEILRSLGCPRHQGWLYGQAVKPHLLFEGTAPTAI
jgi:diguanylate cyclase (GGDEF)-like protein